MMEYIGTLLVAIVCFVLGYVMGGIRMRRKILDYVSSCMEDAETFKDESAINNEQTYCTFWDGASNVTKDILSTFCYKIKEEHKDE